MSQPSHSSGNFNGYMERKLSSEDVFLLFFYSVVDKKLWTSLRIVILTKVNIISPLTWRWWNIMSVWKTDVPYDFLNPLPELGIYHWMTLIYLQLQNLDHLENKSLTNGGEFCHLTHKQHSFILWPVNLIDHEVTSYLS